MQACRVNEASLARAAERLVCALDAESRAVAAIAALTLCRVSGHVHGRDVRLEWLGSRRQAAAGLNDRQPVCATTPPRCAHARRIAPARHCGSDSANPCA